MGQIMTLGRSGYSLVSGVDADALSRRQDLDDLRLAITDDNNASDENNDAFALEIDHRANFFEVDLDDLEVDLDDFEAKKAIGTMPFDHVPDKLPLPEDDDENFSIFGGSQESSHGGSVPDDLAPNESSTTRQ